MKKDWFAVKTLYYQEAKGKAKNKDKFYVKSSVTLEERIVIFFCENYNKAIKLAEKDAKEYSKYTYENMYGEIVHTYFTGMYDAIQMWEEPGNGVEVFGVIDLFLKKADMKKALKIRAGVFNGKNDRKLRNRFCHK